MLTHLHESTPISFPEKKNCTLFRLNVLRYIKTHKHFSLEVEKIRKGLRGQMVAVLGMLCCQWDSWHPKVRKCRQNARRYANTLVKFTEPEKAIPAVYLPQVD